MPTSRRCDSCAMNARAQVALDACSRCSRAHTWAWTGAATGQTVTAVVSTHPARELAPEPAASQCRLLCLPPVLTRQLYFQRNKQDSVFCPTDEELSWPVRAAGCWAWCVLGVGAESAPRTFPPWEVLQVLGGPVHVPLLGAATSTPGSARLPDLCRELGT